MNGAGEKNDQTKLWDSKQESIDENNKMLLLTEATSESSTSSCITPTTTTHLYGSIKEEVEDDEAFDLSPGLEKFFAKPAMDYVVDFYDAFSNIDDGGVAIMMEYMDGGMYSIVLLSILIRTPTSIQCLYNYYMLSQTSFLRCYYHQYLQALCRTLSMTAVATMRSPSPTSPSKP